MAITIQEVKAVAELAKLDLSDDEANDYTKQLNKILEYVDKLSKVDISDVPPTASVLPIQNVMRDDTPGETLPPEKVTRNAANAEANQFKVSAVLDNSQ
jgi:aspartyl-tRNA(Asn)/glutamyl-tRNA(Gln) amidotransferase subunit C